MKGDNLRHCHLNALSRGLVYALKSGRAEKGTPGKQYSHPCRDQRGVESLLEITSATKEAQDNVIDGAIRHARV